MCHNYFERHRKYFYTRGNCHLSFENCEFVLVIQKPGYLEDINLNSIVYSSREALIPQESVFLNNTEAKRQGEGRVDFSSKIIGHLLWNRLYK